MAYTKRIVRQCQQGTCIKQATLEVFNSHNASCGVFCAPHGKLKESELRRQERERSNAKAGKP